METPYKILINMQLIAFGPNGTRAMGGRLLSEYEPGDPLIQTWEATIENHDAIEPDVHTTLERIFAIHNSDSRPDGQLGPSLSVSDVVIFGETAWSVAQMGFHEEHPPFNILDTTWAEYMEEHAV